MLKSSKLSHKPHKSSKDSMMRKEHVSKKILRGRSPVRSSGTSRPPPMKHISPGMKRSHPVPKRKASHSPRLRSIASSPHRSLSHHNKQESPESMDRMHAMKAFKYEKRKHVSNSPMRHMGPDSPHRPVMQHEQRGVLPYAERFQASGSVHSAHYSPSRKKSHREAERFLQSRSRSASPSPPRRHMVEPLRPESHIPPRPHVSSPHNRHQSNVPLGHGERGKHNYDIPIKHRTSPIIPSSRGKDLVVKPPFPNANNRYRTPSPDGRYLPVSRLKSYGPTLHERFSSVIDRSELSVRYSREDLEKITIDVRNPSPPRRHLVNPAKLKLVSRPHEGHRPIFDRDELKYASKDVREDVYYDRKTSNSYEASHSVNVQGSENYQITRNKYGSHPENYSSSSRHPVNERYPAHETKKGASLDRDEREYARAPGSRSYVHSRSRSRSGDRDFRSDRYLDAKPSSSRPEYQSRPPIAAPESRINVPYPHRKTSLPVDARHKLNIRKGERESHLPSVRSESKDQYFGSSRHYPEPIPSSRVDRREHHLPDPEPPKWNYRSRSPSREKLMDLPRRPDKYSYKPWNDKLEMSVKSPSYHEYASREGSSSFRGSSRPFRSTRGFRSRGFRGPIRGSSFHRGSFRGSYRGSSSPRARGLSRR